ncbi:MAG: wax ester/triacylglycerol synthase family O-acyltransferase [Nocardioidaceae bacterium]
MRQLTSLDAQFLHVESTTTVGHVGGLLVLDPSGAPGGELTLSALRAVLEPRLHLAAPLRQRLVEVPLGLGRPYWVDDPEFDLEFHLREVALPLPGDAQQLGEQVARIHARPLDRTRPLWEMYLIHGVDGDRSAIYSKIHHAAIDGVSGAEILATIMDLTQEPRVVEDIDWTPGPLPGRVELLERGLLSTFTQPWDLLRTVPKTLPHLADLPGATNVPGIRAISDVSAAVAKVVTGGAASSPAERRELRPPRTPFNGPITAHRRFSFGSLPLADIKTVKNAFGMTVNDVVMALCASALRRWLLDHDALPTVPIVVAVPVSIRSADRPGSGGNQISVMVAEMPTEVGDPAERLTSVTAAMTKAKRHFQAVPATILQDLSTVIPTALSGLAARQLFKLVTAPGLPFNLFVSNVPGPQVPLYVAGARVLGLYPVSAVTDMTGGLNITLFSYDGSLDFGLIACRELVPDVWNLIDYLRDALAELLDLIPAGPAG